MSVRLYATNYLKENKMKATEAVVRRCSSKTPVLDSLFNKVPGIQTCNFVK